MAICDIALRTTGYCAVSSSLRFILKLSIPIRDFAQSIIIFIHDVSDPICIYVVVVTRARVVYLHDMCA